MNFMPCSPIWMPASESYWTPRLKSMRANPISQANLPVVLGAFLDLGDRVLVHVDDVVQEMDGGPDGPLQVRPVDLVPAVLGAGEMVLQIDAPEIARLVGQQRLLAARVGGLDHRVVWRGIRPVGLIDEEEPRLAVPP